MVNDYFLVRTTRFDPRGALSDDDLAAEHISEMRWWRHADIAEYGGTDRLAAAHQITSLHTGELLEDILYEWAEPLRHAARIRTVEAYTAIVQANAEVDRSAAIHALHRAIDLDPTAEGVYREAMRLYAEANRPAPIKRLLRQLEAHLQELDLEPEPETTRLAGYLTRKLTS